MFASIHHHDDFITPWLGFLRSAQPFGHTHIVQSMLTLLPTDFLPHHGIFGQDGYEILRSAEQA
jgi:hypothetical protein